MSNVVVSVVESVTSVTVSEQDVAVAVTESPVTIVTGTSGPQGATGSTGATGAQGPSGVIAVDGTYITNSGTSTSANLSFVPSALTIEQSQITGLVSALAGKAALTASQTFTGTQTILTGAVGNIGLLIQNPASATNHLQVWSQNGVYRGVVTANGSLSFGSTTALGTITSTAASATLIPFVAKGAASQTANLQEWQNSAGSMVAQVTAAGEIFSTNSLRGPALWTSNYLVMATEENSGGKLRIRKATAQVASPGANVGAIYFRDGTNAGTLKLVVRAGTAGAETTILDNIPQ